MTSIRPNLAGLPETVVAYIEHLESRLEEMETALSEAAIETPGRAEPQFEPSEPPTTVNLITVSAGGMAKRTPRHLYARQRRGGMGIFDLDSAEGDPPAFLVLAEESAALILLTTHGRAFRTPVAEIVEAPVRSRGQSIVERLPLRSGERLAVATPDQAGAFLCLVSERGQVRRIASNYLGKNLSSGAVLHDPKDGGAPVAACWSRGNDEIVIVTRLGRGIRFAERLIPVRGCLGLRVEPDDRVAAIAAAPADGGVFLAAGDGKGALRMLETFAANKSPGSGGKALMKTDALVGALAVDPSVDLFMISRLGKLIRFGAREVPPKEGAVQGVNCMALRADLCTAVAGCAVPPAP